MSDSTTGIGSGFFSRLKQSLFGDAGPSTGLSDSDLVALANSYKVITEYKDQPDERKIALVAQVARINARGGEPFYLLDGITRVLERLKSLDLAGARIIFGFAASNRSFTRTLSLKSLARVMEKQPAGTFNDAELRRCFDRMKLHLQAYDTGVASKFEGSEVARRFEALLGAAQMFSSADPNDWSGSAIPGIATLAAIRLGDGQTLDAFLRSLDKAKPTVKWSAPAAELATGPQGPAIRQTIIDWLATLQLPGDVSARAKLWVDTADPAMLSQVASFMVRSTVWMLAHWRDAETVATIQRTAEAALTKLSVGRMGVNYRSLTAANACILALGEIATPEAVQALGRIKLRLRDEKLSKLVATAMEAAAGHCSMTVGDLQELAVPTLGLDAVGAKSVPLGEFAARLRVEIDDRRHDQLRPRRRQDRQVGAGGGEGRCRGGRRAQGAQGHRQGDCAGAAGSPSARRIPVPYQTDLAAAGLARALPRSSADRHAGAVPDLECDGE